MSNISNLYFTRYGSKLGIVANIRISPLGCSVGRVAFVTLKVIIFATWQKMHRHPPPIPS